MLFGNRLLRYPGVYTSYGSMDGGSGAASGASSGPAIDNEQPYIPEISITAVDAVKPEGNSGPTAYTFLVSRRLGKPGIISTVDYAVTGSGDNPASAGDFVGGAFPSGAFAFAENETSKLLTIYVQGDADVESDKSFTVMLFNPVNAVIGTAAASGTIQNDDEEPLIPFNPSVDILSSVRAVWDGAKIRMLLRAQLSGDTNAKHYYVVYDTSFKNYRNVFSPAGILSKTPILYNDSIHVIEHSSNKKYLAASKTTTISPTINPTQGGASQVVGAVIDGASFVYRDSGYVKEGSFDGVNVFEIADAGEPFYTGLNIIAGFKYQNGDLGFVTHSDTGEGNLFWYGRKSGGNWASGSVTYVKNILNTEVLPGDVYWLEAVVDTSSNLHVLMFYYDSSLSNFSVRLFKRTDSGTWSSSKNFIDGSTYTGSDVGFALDTNDKIHISWSGDNAVHYASDKTGSWVTQTNITNTPVGRVHENADLVLDGNNTAHILYFDRTTSPAAQVLSHISI
jgi:hypothetical protein